MCDQAVCERLGVTKLCARVCLKDCVCDKVVYERLCAAHHRCENSIFYTVRNLGGQCTTDRHCPTKTLSARGDMESDQLHVPANRFNYFTGNGKRPSQEPQSWILFLHGCRNLRLFSASCPTLFTRYFYRHGKGLSREP